MRNNALRAARSVGSAGPINCAMTHCTIGFWSFILAGFYYSHIGE
jgi:hypothetical protein